MESAEHRQPLYLSVLEAAKLVDPKMGRSAAYSFFHRSGILVRIGRKLLVPVRALERLGEAAK